MHYFCEQSENTRLIVERFLETWDRSDPLFLAGAVGSEYLLLVKEYAKERGIDSAAILSLEPSMLEESVLNEWMVMLSRTAIRPELLLLRISPTLDAVMETRLLRFLENPAFPDSKLLVIMDGFDPFEEGIVYPEALAERCKSALFVVPPLCNRLADLAYFTVELLKAYSAERDLQSPVQLAQDAQDLLLEYDWPGNYAELSEVLRALVYGSRKGGLIERENLRIAINLGRTQPID
ncbi:MAG: hypothetical protein ABQ298_15375 [Puniceicoccaceae bacterium]